MDKATPSGDFSPMTVISDRRGLLGAAKHRRSRMSDCLGGDGGGFAGFIELLAPILLLLSRSCLYIVLTSSTPSRIQSLLEQIVHRKVWISVSFLPPYYTNPFLLHHLVFDRVVNYTKHTA